jgi:hypothetical protein
MQTSVPINARPSQYSGRASANGAGVQKCPMPSRNVHW